MFTLKYISQGGVLRRYPRFLHFADEGVDADPDKASAGKGKTCTHVGADAPTGEHLPDA